MRRRGVRRRWWWLLIGLALLGVAASRPAVWQVLFPLPHWRLVQGAAVRRGLDPWLVAALVETESRGDAAAVSDKGAVGLMQLMPSTAAWVARQQGRPAPPAARLLDPRENISLGTWYLAYLLRRYGGNSYLALAAYNAGEHNVDAWRAAGIWRGDVRDMGRIPFPETRRFVRRVQALRHLYRWLYGQRVAR